VKKTLPKKTVASSRIPLCKPYVSEDEEKAAAEVLRSGWLMQGPKVEEFERLIAEYVGVKHAVAVNSGTTALTIAYAAAGLQLGDSVFMPSHSFVATANAALHHDVEPVFIDIDPHHYNMNPAEVEPIIEPDSGHLVVVHQIGAAADMAGFVRLAAKYDLVLIEDAACSLGATFNGRQTGSFGTVACLSFHPRKIITTGEGGMLLTNSESIAESAQAMRNHGLMQKGKAGPRCVAPGYNYRMTDIQAAIGVVQFRKLEEILRLRRQIAERYEKTIANMPAFELPKWPEGSTTNYQSFVVKVVDEAIERDGIVRYMNKKGIDSKPGIQPIHREPLYEEYADDDELPQTVRAAERSFFLPLYPGMTVAEQEYVVDILGEALDACSRGKGGK
jgi:perosamine synthetase